MAASPKWRRRKEERPADICAAALAVFAEKGFAGAKTDEIARRAGLSKGALYLYFPSKEDLFRAVVQDAVLPNIAAVERILSTMDPPFADKLRVLLPKFAELVAASKMGAVAKMVIGESRNFPELAKVWHDEVVLKGIGMVSALVAEGQRRGEVRPGDPRTHAFSIMGPMLIGVLWRETFTPVGGAEIDLTAIARQHVETVLTGLVEEESAR